MAYHITMSKQLYHYKRDGKGKGKRESSSTTHHPARGEGVHSLCRCTDGQNYQHFPRMRECAAIQVYANLNSASSTEFALMLKYPRRRHLQNEHIRHLEARYNLLLLSLFWTSLTASRSITPPPNFASSDAIQASIGLKAPPERAHSPSPSPLQSTACSLHSKLPTTTSTSMLVQFPQA